MNTAIKTVGLSLLLIFSGCSSDEQAFFEAKTNFTYVEDVSDSWEAYDSSKEFYGDCEDFAFSLQRKTGGDVWLVEIPEGLHAVLVKDNIAYDFINRLPVMKKNYDGVFIRIIELNQKR